MSDEGTFAACMSKAQEELERATGFHKLTTDPVSNVPDVPSYRAAIHAFKAAARLFGACAGAARDPVSRGRASAWQYYCLAMACGDEAVVNYRDPDGDKELVLKCTPKASVYIRFALDEMPWGTVEGEDAKEKARWEGLDYSYQGLECRVRAELLRKQGKFREAFEAFMEASEIHRQASIHAGFAQDWRGSDRAMGRYHSARRDAYLAMSLAEKGRKREEYAQKAEEEAKRAADKRPKWNPFQNIERQIQEENKQRMLAKKAKRDKIFEIMLSSVVSGIVGVIIGVFLSPILQPLVSSSPQPLTPISAPSPIPPTPTVMPSPRPSNTPAPTAAPSLPATAHSPRFRL